MSRSALIEQAMWEPLSSRNPADSDREEMARINTVSAELYKEALDTLNYQAGN
jgi:hypothetical protein